MKVLLALSVIVAAASAAVLPPQQLTAFDYHNRFGVPNADRIRSAEEAAAQNPSRIIGGSQAFAGQFPHQCGLIIPLTNGFTSVCGSSVLSNTRLLTAAHCWFDGWNQAIRFDVVCGSITLFTGGTRMSSNNVHMHEGWNTNNLNNDLAMIIVAWLNYSNVISPIALPSGAELSSNFVGFTGTASGFGINHDWQNGVPTGQRLYHVSVPVITNAARASSYGNVVIASTICTSGAGTRGTCGGDSGGPFVVFSNNRNILAGVTSFGAEQCEIGAPSAYARVTAFINWILIRM